MSNIPFSNDPAYNGHPVIVFTIIWIPVQIICVALRYYARSIKSFWGYDDILIFIALLLQICQGGLMIIGVQYGGVGHHFAYLEAHHPAMITIWFKVLLASSSVYALAVQLPKIAICYLYLRLFPTKEIRILIYIVLCVIIGMTISTSIAILCQCRPFAANWDNTIKATCVNRNALCIWSSLPNIATDVALLILPMRVVWNLHATRHTKILLTITFAVGSCGLITCILRFINFVQYDSFTDSTWTAGEHSIWSQIEPGVYLISACLPAYRPLIERILTPTSRSKASTSGPSKDTSEGARNVSLQAYPTTIASHKFRRLEENHQERAQSVLVADKDVLLVEQEV